MREQVVVPLAQPSYGCVRSLECNQAKYGINCNASYCDTSGIVVGITVDCCNSTDLCNGNEKFYSNFSLLIVLIFFFLGIN